MFRPASGRSTIRPLVSLLPSSLAGDKILVALATILLAYSNSHVLRTARGSVDFIFMLTRDDQTVEDSLEVLDAIRPLSLRHIGFKDIGVGPAVLQELNRRIKAQGAISYLEVVGTTPEACLRSVRVGREIGVDRLLGGTDADAALRIIEGSGVEYYPFPGFPHGHPTVLGGGPEEVAAHCKAFVAKGCAGVDLLAYRATDAEPLDLVRAARRALGGHTLIVAGSVDQPARIEALADAGADAFTIGSAVFNGTFSPRKGALVSQLRDVLAACG
jgi:hypothetical protein